MPRILYLADWMCPYNDYTVCVCVVFFSQKKGLHVLPLQFGPPHLNTEFFRDGELAGTWLSI